MEEGTEVGDICGRGDCKEIIVENYPDDMGGCSCHIHPPCSFCTFDAAYCDGCGWEPEYQP